MNRHNDIMALREAAEQGNAEAQYQLGRRYDRSRDYRPAEYWYRRAAEQRHRQAQFWLGVLFDYGHGVERNRAEAIRWYRKAGHFALARARQAEMQGPRGETTGAAADKTHPHI